MNIYLFERCLFKRISSMMKYSITVDKLLPFLILFVFVIVARDTAVAFDFKGIDVGGQNNSEEKVQSTLGINCGGGSEGRTVCNGTTSIGGAFAVANIVISPKGVVTRIALKINSYDFQKVVDVAIEKYGKPTKTSNEIEQNRMGAKFQNATYLWQENKGKYIKITRYYPTFDDGEVYFGTAEDTALLRQINKPKKEDI